MTRLALVAAVVALVALPSASSAVALSDPAGDAISSGQLIGPDMTAVEVTNTPGGVLTFRVTIANYEALPAHSVIAVVFDTDKNGLTGDQGFENAVAYVVDPTGQARAVYERYDESRFSLTEVPATDVTATFEAGVLTASVPRTRLRNATTFDFGLFAVVFNDDESEVAGDVAPDFGLWTYELVGLPPPRLSAPKLRVSPKRPVAGKQFSVAATVTRLDTGATVSSGKVACNVRVGTTRVRARGVFRGENAHCLMTVPRSAKGMRLTGTLTVRTAGATITKRFSFRVV